MGSIIHLSNTTNLVSEMSLDGIIFRNRAKIVTPTVTKAASTSGSYLYKDLTKYKVVSLRFSDFLRSTAGKSFTYVSASLAWLRTSASIFTRNPAAFAVKRGYVLK